MKVKDENLLKETLDFLEERINEVGVLNYILIEQIIAALGSYFKSRELLEYFIVDCSFGKTPKCVEISNKTEDASFLLDSTDELFRALQFNSMLEENEDEANQVPLFESKVKIVYDVD